MFGGRQKEIPCTIPKYSIEVERLEQKSLEQTRVSFIYRKCVGKFRSRHKIGLDRGVGCVEDCGALGEYQ